MTTQNTLGALPVLSLPNPPEGKQAARFQIVLTGSQPSYAASFQLNSQAGLSFSQVMSISIDNSANAYGLTIVHGVLNEQVNVPAFAKVILPTFSSRASYPLNVAAYGLITPSISMAVTVVLMNYPRAPGTFAGLLSPSISGTGQTVTPLLSGRYSIDVFTSEPVILNPGNWTISEVEMTLEGFLPVATGVINAFWNLNVSGFYPNDTIYSAILLSQSFNYVANDTNWHAGMQVCRPARLSFPNGLSFIPGVDMTLQMDADQFSPFTTLDEVVIRVNITGTGSPT